MKLLFTFLLPIAVLCTSLTAVEYGTIKQLFGASEESISLGDGDVLEILSLGSIYPASINPWSEYWKFYKILPDGTEALVQYVRTTSDNVQSPYSNAVVQNTFVGPCSLVARSYAAERGESAQGLGISVDYKITRASEVEYKNVNIVALPSATVGAGTHEIVVEASDDLQTWTPVHSSSIGGDKAFFRTRVVESGN